WSPRPPRATRRSGVSDRPDSEMSRRRRASPAQGEVCPPEPSNRMSQTEEKKTEEKKKKEGRKRERERNFADGGLDVARAQLGPRPTATADAPAWQRSRRRFRRPATAPVAQAPDHQS